MTNKEKELIYNDTRYVVIYWKTGIIYTKMALCELRCKRLEKLFKGEEYHVRPCSYNDYFMGNVVAIYRRLKRRDNWYYSRGYKKSYFKDKIGYEFYNPKDEYDD